MTLHKNFEHHSNSSSSDSIDKKKLSDEIVIGENGNVVFHWADFSETCDLVKLQLGQDPFLMQDFKLREQSINQLTRIPVWIRTEKNIQQTTMLELYENFMLNKRLLAGGVNPSRPLEISLISSSGPYKSMPINECFNKSTYRDFILVYLLQNKIPRRDFRVRLRSRLLLEYGPDYAHAEIICLEQLSMKGMLLSVNSDIYMEKLADLESVRLLINTNMLVEAQDRDLSELKDYLGQYAFNLLYTSRKEDSVSCPIDQFNVQSSFDFSSSKKVYLFIDYDKASWSSPAPLKNIRDFVSMTKDLVKNYYQDIQNKSLICPA
jgi:hypothetical protein